MLDPQAQALIRLMTDRGVPPVHTLSPVQARAAYLERRAYSQPFPPSVGEDLAEVRDLLIAAGQAPALPLRLYLPAFPITTGQPLPTLVYFHGGGWTMGDLDTHDVLCRELCAQSRVALVSVDYRVGPEHPFPAAVEDCLAATRWVRGQAASLGLDGARVAVGGDSAGGNLAAVVALLMRDAGDAPLKHQLLIYPATDLRATSASHQLNGRGYLLTTENIAYYRDNYIAEPASWSDWRASPLLAPNLSRLAPALVLTAGYDPLRDEGRQYADALSAAGTRTQYICFERQIHGFITMGRVIDEARTAVSLCASVLRAEMTDA